MREVLAKLEAVLGADNATEITIDRDDSKHPDRRYRVSFRGLGSPRHYYGATMEAALRAAWANDATPEAT